MSPKAKRSRSATPSRKAKSPKAKSKKAKSKKAESRKAKASAKAKPARKARPATKPKAAAKAPKASAPPSFVSAADLLDHWQGHRRLTRRTIEAFPDDKLFTFSVGGMRTFGELAAEMLGMAAPMAKGLVNDEWDPYTPVVASSKQELLRLWDESTKEIDAAWAKIPAKRFGETVTSFGMFTGPVHWQILYAIDNEVHHRGQGYTYLRALGITPPLFYERT